jgi:hypothetical protein
LDFSSSKVVLQDRCTYNFGRKNFLTINEGICIYIITQHLLIFYLKLEISLTILPLGNGSDVVVPRTSQAGFQI